MVLNSLIQTVRPTRMLGISGLYVPADPGAPDKHAKQGMLLVAVGKLFEGRAKPSFVVSHERPLEEAPEAYEKFDKRV